MAQRNLTGKILDAARQPLANLDVRIWPAWPTAAGITDPATAAVLVRRHFHTRTDEAGVFSISLEVTPPAAGWHYRAQFQVDHDQADLAFILPAGSGVAQLADHVIEQVAGTDFVVVSQAERAAARAEVAAAAAAQAVPATGRASQNGFQALTGPGVRIPLVEDFAAGSVTYSAANAGGLRVGITGLWSVAVAVCLSGSAGIGRVEVRRWVGTTESPLLVVSMHKPDGNDAHSGTSGIYKLNAGDILTVFGAGPMLSWGNKIVGTALSITRVAST